MEGKKVFIGKKSYHKFSENKRKLWPRKQIEGKPSIWLADDASVYISRRVWQKRRTRGIIDPPVVIYGDGYYGRMSQDISPDFNQSELYRLDIPYTIPCNIGNSVSATSAVNSLVCNLCEDVNFETNQRTVFKATNSCFYDRHILESGYMPEVLIVFLIQYKEDADQTNDFNIINKAFYNLKDLREYIKGNCKGYTYRVIQTLSRCYKSPKRFLEKMGYEFTTLSYDRVAYNASLSKAKWLGEIPAYDMTDDYNIDIVNNSKSFNSTRQYLSEINRSFMASVSIPIAVSLNRYYELFLKDNHNNYTALTDWVTYDN